MVENIDVPPWAVLVVIAVIVVAVMAVLLWPKEKPVTVDKSCPDMAFLMERVNVNDSTVLLMDKNANLSYPQTGTLTIRSAKNVPVSAAINTVTCRKGGSKVNENINYYYCEGLLIGGPLTNENGVVTQIVNRAATLIYSSLDGNYVGRECATV